MAGTIQKFLPLVTSSAVSSISSTACPRTYAGRLPHGEPDHRRRPRRIPARGRHASNLDHQPLRAPAKDVAPAGIGSTPVKLCTASRLLARPHGPQSPDRRDGHGAGPPANGPETINRQLDIFGTRFKNLRVSAVMSALLTGGICFDATATCCRPMLATF